MQFYPETKSATGVSIHNFVTYFVKTKEVLFKLLIFNYPDLVELPAGSNVQHIHAGA